MSRSPASSLPPIRPAVLDAGIALAVAAGAVLVGLLESFGSFYASAFKEVIVFTVILPVLLWRSFQQGHDDEEES